MSRLSIVSSAQRGQSMKNAGRRVVTLGWHRDPPEFRDYCISWRKPGSHGKNQLINGQNGVVQKLAELKSPILSTDVPTGACYDNIKHCSPVEDQGSIGSCTAQSVVGLMEYNMRRDGGNHVDGSRLFVYKVTRNLMGVVGDQGGYLRTAMKAVGAFGVPPEEHWPYDVSRFDDEPDAFVYSYATNFKTMQYARLDGPGVDNHEVLESLKRTLHAGHCVVFGFQTFSSMSGAPDVPFPVEQDKSRGGHAVMAVGFDDSRKNISTSNNGAIVFRNSWGTGWGVNGYGYLPYDYVREGLCRDFWTAFSWDQFDEERHD